MDVLPPRTPLPLWKSSTSHAGPLRARGWLIEIDVEAGRRNQHFTELLSGPDMEKLSRSHLHSFHRRIDDLLAARPSRVGASMADGGRAVTDPRAMLGPARYLKLVQELLT